MKARHLGVFLTVFAGILVANVSRAAIDCVPACEAPFVCETTAGVCYLPGALVINEIDYDQPSTDTAEFVEIKNTATVPVWMGGVQLKLLNGNSSPNPTYLIFNLPAAFLAPGDYFVVCANAANTPNCDLDVSPDTNLIQNGSPDGLGLFLGDTILDVVAYAGNMDPEYTEGSGVGLVDPSNGVMVGLSRYPDGVDTQVNNVDFSVRCITPGAPNTAFATLCTCGNNQLDAGEACDDGGRVPGDGCDENCKIEPVCTEPCVHGRCVAEDTCECDSGWEGATCAVPICEESCVHGTCTAPDTCACEPGWEGPLCDVSSCDPACVHGTCIGVNDCECDKYWVGPVCADPYCDPPCEEGDVCIGGVNSCLKAGALVINEIDYVMPGGVDRAEFIELFNASGESVSLGGVEIALIDGHEGGAVEYARHSLPDVILEPGAFFVLCADALLFEYCDLEITPAVDWIQNGAPDAAALFAGEVLLDTVSYEGDTGAPFTEGSGEGLVDPADRMGLGISRVEDGLDIDINNKDFGTRCVTPGMPNSAWDGACDCGDLFVDPDETCDDGNRESGDGCDAYCGTEPGWDCPATGGTCSPVCDPACIQGICTAPGTCTCEAGWGGAACDACAPGFWGLVCEACPDCGNGTCDDGLGGLGTCTCDFGFAEPDCAVCLPGHWGSDCDACPVCVHGACREGLDGDGACACDPGWEGDLCDRCAPGFWGTDCQACPTCVNGACSEGLDGDGTCVCDPGWLGALCDDKTCYPACDAPLVCQEEAGECHMPGALVINEIDYDQPGTDTAEFVEIFNLSSALIPLSGVQLVLINGASSKALMYASYALPPIQLAPGDFYVVCGNAAAVPNCDLDVSKATGMIQNGAPDAAALVLGTTILDTVSYGGDTMEGDVLSVYTETRGVAVARSDSTTVEGIGIGRDPDGTDTDVNDDDFAPRCVTPGGPNVAWGTACRCGDLTVDEGETCDDGGREAGDGCSVNCTVEDGWTCPSTGGVCSPLCDPACVQGECVAPDTCRCEDGWEGASCADAVCDPACVEGACTAPDVCTCDAGWEGVLCDAPICDSACVHGSCVGPDTCACDGNWGGPLCDACAGHWAGEDCAECADGHFGAGCEGACPACVHGACDDGLAGTGACICDTGWGGALCDAFACDPACGVNASCTGPNTCTCDEGFEGDGFACQPINACAGAADWTACEDGACFGDVCEAVGDNDACADAAQMAVGEPMDGTVDGFHAWWGAAPDCVAVAGGLIDAYFQFQAEAGVRYRVTVTPEGDLDVAVMLREVCDPEATACETGANDGAGGAAEVAFLTPDADGTVVIQVVRLGDGAPTSLDFQVLVEVVDDPGDPGGGEDVGGEDAGTDTGFADEASPDVIEPLDVVTEDPGVGDDPGAPIDPGTAVDPGTVTDPGGTTDPGTTPDTGVDAVPTDGFVGDLIPTKTTGGGCAATGSDAASHAGALVLLTLLGVLALAVRRRRVV